MQKYLIKKWIQLKETTVRPANSLALGGQNIRELIEMGAEEIWGQGFRKHFEEEETHDNAPVGINGLDGMD